MASTPLIILETLDRHLSAPGHIRLLGGAALILGYGRQRSTEDADLLLDDTEFRALIDQSENALVPEVLRETWAAALPRLEARLSRP